MVLLVAVVPDLLPSQMAMYGRSLIADAALTIKGIISEKII